MAAPSPRSPHHLRRTSDYSSSTKTSASSRYNSNNSNNSNNNSSSSSRPYRDYFSSPRAPSPSSSRNGNSNRAQAPASAAAASSVALVSGSGSSLGSGLDSGLGSRSGPGSSGSKAFSSSSTSSTTASLVANNSNARIVNSSRKRIRASPSQFLDPSDSDQWLVDSTIYPPTLNTDATPQSISYSSMTVSGGFSPAPFINTKYKLAGGLDTPTRIAAEGFEALENSYLDHDFRRKWASARSDYDFGRQTITVTGLERERNGGRKRSHSSMEDAEEQQQQQQQQHKSRRESWGQFVFSVVGGIAGKMWEFCRGGAGAFRGFTAGGGAGYMITDTSPCRISNGRFPADGLATPIPGQYPEEIAANHHIHEQQRDEYRGNDELDHRPAKRQHRDWGGVNDWVFVSESPSHQRRSPDSFSWNYNTTTTTTTSSRGSARPSLSGPQQRSFLPRPAPSSPKSPPRPRSSAAVGVAGAGGASYAVGSPANLSRNRAASFASPRATSRPQSHSRRTSAEQHHHPSPVQIDVARYTAQRQREERQADASMRKLNQQLQAMIRQGKEALATKFEVEEDFDHHDAVMSSGMNNSNNASFMDDGCCEDGGMTSEWS